MNILFSSDNNYAQHLGVAIYSLLDYNRQMDKIRVFVVDNEISDVNRERLVALVSGFPNASIDFILFAKWKNSLHLNMSWSISISSYARLFVASMLPADINKVLYLDCDMIVCDSLEELWNTDMNGCVVAAVQDTVGDVKNAVGLSPTDSYFNAGMLLIDLKSWRKKDCEEKCIRFIEERQGCVTHHDQGVLNGVFRNAWMRLPLKYNLMTIHYLLGLKKIQKFYNDQAEFYPQEEVAEALAHPAILHFTPSFTSRPWVKTCKHPLRHLYWDTLAKTPWEGAKPEKDGDKWYVRVINWWHRALI